MWHLIRPIQISSFRGSEKISLSKVPFHRATHSRQRAVVVACTQLSG